MRKAASPDIVGYWQRHGRDYSRQERPTPIAMGLLEASMFCQPCVAEADYPELERVARPYLPRDFAGWLALCDEWDHLHKREGVVRVEINPRAFTEYMKNAGRPLDVQALLDFAAFNPWHDPDF
jgi:hypothetical protein